MSIAQKQVKKKMQLNELEDFSFEVWELIKQKMSRGGVFVGLVGSLGAGKSTFCKKLFAKMGVVDEVVSPTYVLNISYKTNLALIEHLDVWRIENFSEIERLGIKKMLENKSVVVVEWADKFKPDFEELVDEEQMVWIFFEQTGDEDSRNIELICT